MWHAHSLPRLPRHPFHGAPNWKPSGIPVAMVWRPWCGGQYRLSFFGRRAGIPPLPADGRSGHAAPPNLNAHPKNEIRRQVATNLSPHVVRPIGLNDEPGVSIVSGERSKMSA